MIQLPAMRFIPIRRVRWAYHFVVRIFPLYYVDPIRLRIIARKACRKFWWTRKWDLVKDNTGAKHFAGDKYWNCSMTCFTPVTKRQNQSHVISGEHACFVKIFKIVNELTALYTHPGLPLLTIRASWISWTEYACQPGFRRLSVRNRQCGRLNVMHFL